MRKSRFTEAQIVAILRELDAGAPVEELARRHGIDANTIRLWRSKYAGMSTSDLARLKHLETENAQVQRIIARQRVKIDALEELMRIDATRPRPPRRTCVNSRANRPPNSAHRATAPSLPRDA